MFRLYKGAWIDDNPPHLAEKKDKQECSHLLEQGGYLVRSTYDFDTPGPTSFWFVIKDSFGGFEELTPKMRNQVRKSLKTYDARMVSRKEVAEYGLRIYNSAIKGYNPQAQLLTQPQIEGLLSEQIDDDNKKYEYWMVFERETEKAVAIAINILKPDCCEYSAMKCDTDYMHNSSYPYYGLIYEMNRHYLEDLCLRYVYDGSRSITEHSDIQSFLIKKFNFRKAYCNLQVEYKWWLSMAVKVLYPFRKILPSKKAQSLLRMEAMCRNEY